MCKKDEDVEHQYVKIYYNTNQYPEFTFCGPSKISHSVRRLSNHYKICFDPKLGHGTCEMIHITCACIQFTSTIDQPWTIGVKHISN